ncbi:dienelactone hydrolase [Fusarium avenaceum]|nr:dienelactone hydrolase [Fusarium avenaceum]
MRFSLVVTRALGLGPLAEVANAKHRGDLSLIAHTGESLGHEIKYRNTTLYVSKPVEAGSERGSQIPDIGVLYLTDVFGIELPQNRLLSDSFARAGYVTVAPDLFNGHASTVDLNEPGFDYASFAAEHGPNVTDPIIDNAISYMREKLGVKTIAASGYCFGGRYAWRVLTKGRGVDLGFAAHPSMLTDEEVLDINGPASLAVAETDEFLTAEDAFKIESLLNQTGQPYNSRLFGGTMHGFATRANVSDPLQKFAKEEAFLQAVRFFDVWA